MLFQRACLNVTTNTVNNMPSVKNYFFGARPDTWQDGQGWQGRGSNANTASNSKIYVIDQLTVG